MYSISTYTLRRGFMTLTACILLTACGEESIVEPVPMISPVGIWRVSEAGVSESTLRLASDGSFARVVADLSGRTCSSSSGTWRVDGESLSIQIVAVNNGPASGSETYSFAIGGGQLTLGGTGVSGVFSSVSAMVSCVDYGFGSWTGTLAATVDGFEIDFQVVEIRVDVDAGELEIDGSYVDGGDERLLKLQIGASGSLEAGVFTVQNVPGATETFYGLYHPDPGSATFSGFDTTRLSPPGTFTLTAITPERIGATFSFRANPRVEDEVGPGGATFAEIETGRVDLLYR